MNEKNKFIEKVRKASFRKQIVDPYVERMDLKSALETNRNLNLCIDKGFLVLCIAYCMILICAGIIFAWVWCMDYFGLFPYVTGDQDSMMFAICLMMPILTMFGYSIALSEYQNAIRKHVMKLAGVEDDVQDSEEKTE